MGRRLGLAVLVALALIIGGTLLSPRAEDQEIPFRHYGVRGELRIMPELSIEEGHDAHHQIPRSLQAPPPPSVIEDEPESPNATEPLPPQQEIRNQEAREEIVITNPEAREVAPKQVEMHLPQQSNPDFYVLHYEPAQYPLDASSEDRRLPVIFVKASMFVGPDGRVTDVLITSTNGGQAFGDEVSAKLKMMEFGWRVDPGPGRWINTTFHFRSPYFQPEGN